RIAKIAFPTSPMKGQNLPRSEGNTPLFAIPKSAGQNAVVRKNRALSTSSLLQPDFSKSHAQVLQTPIKKSKIVTAFQKQHEALLTNTFKYKVKFLGKGSYSNAWTLEDNKEPIIPGVDNADLVLKAYHGESSGFGELKLRN